MRLALVVLAVGLFLSASATFAAPFTVTGGYSVTEQYTTGGPTISYGLNHTSFSQTGTIGTETAQTNFFTASPAGSCTGGGCVGGTETDTLTVSFTNLHVLGIAIPTLTETAVYTAKYGGSVLSCASGDGVSTPGDTDCVVWTGAANKWNGSTMLSSNLGNGDTLEIFLYNATDWNITPKIGFEVVDAPAPEPASLAMVASGLVGLGLIRRRRS